MTDAKSDEKELRKALQLAVCKIVFDEDRKVGTRSTQGAIAALTELTYQYATKSLVPDLYMFSTHANRKSTISPDDVALVLRKLDPDHLEAFQQEFCRGAGTGKAQIGSKSTTAHRGGKRMSPGRLRKRDEKDVLLLSSSSSSSSSDDDNSLRKEKVGQKRKRNSGALSGSMKPSAASTTGRKSTKTESLLNKFQLRAESRAAAGNQRSFDYDLLSSSSSSDEDDVLQSKPLKSTKKPATGIPAKTAEQSTTSKFSLQPIPFSKMEQSNGSVGNKNNVFLDENDTDDDSTDNDDDFILHASKSTNRIEDNNTSRIEMGNQDLDDDSDDNDDSGAGNRGNDIARGTPKQSQVAEALANLSSDSGMDEDETDEEDEMRRNARKMSSSNRHRPRIESDDDED